jgi:hypothetical protein
VIIKGGKTIKNGMITKEGKDDKEDSEKLGQDGRQALKTCLPFRNGIEMG